MYRNQSNTLKYVSIYISDRIGEKLKIIEDQKVGCERTGQKPPVLIAGFCRPCLPLLENPT